MRLKVAAVAALAVVLVGCSAQQTTDNLVAAERASLTLGDEIARLNDLVSELEAMSPDDPMIDKAKDTLADLTERKAQIDAALAQAQADIAAGGEPTGAVIRAIGSALPPPFSTYAAAAGAVTSIILAILAARRKRDADAASAQAKAEHEAARAAVAAVYLGGSPAVMEELKKQADAQDKKIIHSIVVADNLPEPTSD